MAGERTTRSGGVGGGSADGRTPRRKYVAGGRAAGTANGTATAGADFTATSGTLTIAAGETSGTFTIPITNDTSNEALETFTVTLSNASNASLGKSAVTVSLVDNEAILSNSTALADVLSNTMNLLEEYLTSTIKSLLNNNSLTIDGVSKTYATILSEYGSVTDLEAWI